MAGNMWEWTTEVENNQVDSTILTENETNLASRAVIRGVRFSNKGVYDLIYNRIGEHLVENICIDVEFRIVLYKNIIKKDIRCLT